MEEVWKYVPGYNGKYQVSNFGNVKSVYKRSRKGGDLLTPILNKDGYLQVNLSINGHATHHRVHRLVAESFVENKFNYPFVNHKDENKKNNNAVNLEWCDLPYNIRYGSRTERSFITRKCNKSFHRVLSRSDALKIRKTCIPNDRTYGIKPLSKKYGVSPTTISAIIHDRLWSTEERDCSGENNPHHKLTEQQVKEIRQIYVKGDHKYGQRGLAKKYGVPHSTIAGIIKGKLWKHIL